MYIKAKIMKKLLQNEFKVVSSVNYEMRNTKTK